MGPGRRPGWSSATTLARLRLASQLNPLYWHHWLNHLRQSEVRRGEGEGSHVRGAAGAMEAATVSSVLGDRRGQPAVYTNRHNKSQHQPFEGSDCSVHKNRLTCC